MPSAKGCVASTTARTSWSASHARSPSTPPNPPIRTSPTGSRGRWTRPASEDTTSTPASTSSSASSRASPVPPSRRTVIATPRLERRKARGRTRTGQVEESVEVEVLLGQVAEEVEPTLALLGEAHVAGLVRRPAAADTSVSSARRSGSPSSEPCHIVPNTAPERAPPRNSSPPCRVIRPWWIS